jgi:hypothetical protein
MFASQANIKINDLGAGMQLLFVIGAYYTCPVAFVAHCLDYGAIGHAILI